MGVVLKKIKNQKSINNLQENPPPGKIPLGVETWWKCSRLYISLLGIRNALGSLTTRCDGMGVWWQE